MDAYINDKSEIIKKELCEKYIGVLNQMKTEIDTEILNFNPNNLKLDEFDLIFILNNKNKEENKNDYNNDNNDIKAEENEEYLKIILLNLYFLIRKELHFKFNNSIHNLVENTISVLKNEKQEKNENKASLNCKEIKEKKEKDKKEKEKKESAIEKENIFCKEKLNIIKSITNSITIIEDKDKDDIDFLFKFFNDEKKKQISK